MQIPCHIHIYYGVTETIFKGWIWISPPTETVWTYSRVTYLLLFPMAVCFSFGISSFLNTKIRQFSDMCKYFGITREDIVGKKRDKKIVEPRQICIYLISEMLPLPLTSIGSIMGGRDHTTIMHAKNKIASAVTKDERFRSAVQDIRDMIYKK